MVSRHPWAYLALAFLLAALPAGAEEPQAAPPATGQEIKGTELFDHDYRFALTQPDSNWRLLEESEIRGVTADAVAGFAHVSEGIFLAVIIERQGNFDLESFADQVIEGMSANLQRVDAREPCLFQGVPAMRLVLSLSVNGVKCVFHNYLVIHRGFAHQVLSWGQADKQGLAGMLDRACSKFRFLPGDTITPRSAIKPALDQTGPGWRIESGRFTSAAYGLAVVPPEGWTVVVSHELEEMNTEAFVGLKSGDPERYMSLTAIRAAKTTSEHLRAIQEDRNAQRLVDSEEYFEATILGKPRSLARLTLADRPYILVSGLWTEYGQIFELQAWWSNTLTAEEESAALASITGSLAWLGDDELSELRAELKKVGDTQSGVTVDQTLRGGRYVDFVADCTWTTPPGFWRLRLGEAAQAFADNQETRFAAREVELGIELSIRKQPAGVDLISSHQAAVEGLASEYIGVEAGESAPPPGSVDALRTRLVLPSRYGEPFHGLLETRRTAKHSLHVLVWALAHDFADHQALIDQAVKSFELSASDLKTLVITPAGVRDERMGYVFTNPSGWKASKLPNAAIDGMGSAIQSRPSGDEGLVLMRMYVPAASSSTSLVSVMEGSIAQNLERIMKMSCLEERPYQVLGIPGTRRVFRAADGKGWADLVVFSKNGIHTILALISVTGDLPSLDQVLKGLELLD